VCVCVPAQSSWIDFFFIVFVLLRCVPQVKMYRLQDSGPPKRSPPVKPASPRRQAPSRPDGLKSKVKRAAASAKSAPTKLAPSRPGGRPRGPNETLAAQRVQAVKNYRERIKIVKHRQKRPHSAWMGLEERDKALLIRLRRDKIQAKLLVQFDKIQRVKADVSRFEVKQKLAAVLGKKIDLKAIPGWKLTDNQREELDSLENQLKVLQGKTEEWERREEVLEEEAEKLKSCLRDDALEEDRKNMTQEKELNLYERLANLDKRLYMYKFEPGKLSAKDKVRREGDDR